MCITNNEERVCGMHVDMAISGSIRYAAGCSAAMYRHIIRHEIPSKMVSFHHFDELAREMHLVRPDGSAWSSKFQNAIVPKVVDALQTRHRKLAKAGAVNRMTNKWTDWSKGFLNHRWDGSAHTITEHVGRQLLLLDDGDVHGMSGHGDDEIHPDDSVTSIGAGDRGGGCPWSSRRTMSPGSIVEAIMEEASRLTDLRILRTRLLVGSTDFNALEALEAVMLCSPSSSEGASALVGPLESTVCRKLVTGASRLTKLERELDDALADELNLPRLSEPDPTAGRLWNFFVPLENVVALEGQR